MAGFVGNAANTFARNVQSASRDASRCLASVGGGGGRALQMDMGNNFQTGVGTSANIVMRDDVYRNAVNQIIQSDRQMENKLQHVIRQMEEMCREDFIVPETTPKIQAVLDAVKGSMSEFLDLTTQTTQITEMYVSQIAAADK